LKTQVLYAGNQYALKKNESVLDCLLRSNQSISYSCKAGACHSCLMKLVSGKIPAKAQEGLKPSLKQRDFFLSCQCYPDAAISVQLPSEEEVSVKSSIIEKRFLNHNVMRLRLQLKNIPENRFEARAGQYIVLSNYKNISRSYSIANQVSKDGYMELHIHIIPNGKMSLWLQECAKIGDEVSVRGPMGDCFYAVESNYDYPIIMAGTGTGLAPLYGIIVDALGQGHKGKIQLYHGALKEQDLYYVDELNKISANNNNFTYIPCVLNGEVDKFYRIGNIEDIVISTLPENKSNVLMYLCGAPEMVNSLRIKSFLGGVPHNNINLDAFLPSQ
jgi:CDP-4-dehydro-6-deoxyglucose reductase